MEHLAVQQMPPVISHHVGMWRNLLILLMLMGNAWLRTARAQRGSPGDMRLTGSRKYTRQGMAVGGKASAPPYLDISLNFREAFENTVSFVQHLILGVRCCDG